MSYQWDAEAYARNSDSQFRWAQELIGKLALRGDERVLDIGCGDGRITAQLARRVPRGSVVGVDNSSDMVRKAVSAFPPGSIPNLSFQRIDAQALSFAEDFDAAFSNAALHWVQDHRRMLRGVASSLRPGGRILFQMGGRGNGEEIFSVLDLMMTEEPWRAHFTGFRFPWSFHGPEEYDGWLKEAGLSPRRVDLLPKDLRPRGREGLIGWGRTTWMPYTDKLPHGLRDRFLAEAVDRYLAAHPLTAEGDAVVRMVRLEVEAQKA